MKRVTIKDIAAHLSLSTSTVSRALANDPYIRLETREKILRAAEELNYKRNSLAVNLRYGRTGIVGVVVDEMLSSYVGQAMRGLQDVMQKEGVSTLVACSYHDAAQEARNLLAMESAMVDGLIVHPCHGNSNSDIFNRLISKGVPVVFLGRNPGGLRASEVVVDDYSKVFFLLDHLMKSGRSRIVHVTGDSCSDYFKTIRKAYLDVMLRFGICHNPAMEVAVKPTFEGGVSAVDIVRSRGVGFDAVFAAADLQAIGVMNRLLQLGVKVPQEVAVAGYAGSYLSKMVYPQLTTVEPPLVEMGEKAAMLLLEKIHDPSSSDRTLTVDAKILLRASTHSCPLERQGNDMANAGVV